jgi:predicted RNA-binding Zn ribbon-like protein
MDLANTVMVLPSGDSVDLLGSATELRTWLELQRPRLGDCGFALQELERLRAVREDVRALLTAVATDDALPTEPVKRLNAASAAAPVAPQLRTEDRVEHMLVEEPEEIDDLAALVGAIARSAIRLAVDEERGPLRLCNAPSCGMFFLGRRRWCCSACGNRARAARHYQRRSSRALGARPSRRSRAA